ncbi:MAG: NAD(P)-dependent oxidoreductase [Gammaproteobacteria bacterium]|nr:NAD(P)-dependent oxidoreductase [Gammaproteobacteria bacterium]
MTETIAVVGTGDMGSAVGAALARSGYRVVTDSSGRSALSRSLAETAGIEDVGSLPALLDAADVLLSILPPSAALGFAERVAASIETARARPLFADCNAVAPHTLKRIEQRIAAAGAPFVDVGIVGPAPGPRTKAPTRFYASGGARAALLRWNVPELRVVDMGPEAGRASAIKMCYAALNKGTDALHAAILLAAERLGVRPELMEELAASQTHAASRMAARVPFLAATAERYTGEMHEIAATFEAAGVTPDFHRGAAWLYGLLARTPLAEESRATLPAERSLDDAIGVFVEALAAPEEPDGSS